MLLKCDKKIQFYNPNVLNAITQSRMLLGTNTLYESLDGGDRLVALTGDTGSAISGLAYGGRRVGVAYPGVIYAGDGTTILYRVNVGGAIVGLKYPGSVVRALVINPFDYRQIFVVDERNRVWLSTSEGNSWVEVTGNLGTLTGRCRASTRSWRTPCCSPAGLASSRRPARVPERSGRGSAPRFPMPLFSTFITIRQGICCSPAASAGG